MQIIFQRGINKTSHQLFPLIILALLPHLILSQNTTTLQFNTSFTHCQINLNHNPSPLPLTDPSYIFNSCQMQKCITLGAGSDCRSLITMQLDELTCYWSCCQLQQFNAHQCQANNLTMQTHDNNMNGLLIIIFASCAFGLVVAALCFIVFWLECFKKRDPPAVEPQTPVWRRAPFSDHKCAACDQYGSVVEIACRHFFHVECYRAGMQKGEGGCPACGVKSKRMRLWCNQCHERFIKIGVDVVGGGQLLEVFYNQAKLLHLDCEQDINSCPKTDVRLTSTTNQ